MVILGSVVSARTIMCLVVVITGFLVGCGGEVKLSIIGVQWGLISSVAVSLNSIFTKKVHCVTFLSCFVVPLMTLGLTRRHLPRYV